jgi:hypothetical protein
MRTVDESPDLAMPEPKGWLGKSFHALITRYLSLYVLDNDHLIDVKPMVSLRRFFKNYVAVRTAKEAVDQFDSTPIRDAKRAGRYWLLNGIIHYEPDVQVFLSGLASQLHSDDRLILVYYSALWRPLLRLANSLGLRVKTPEQNWISHSDVENFLLLAGFEAVRRDSRLLCPVRIPVLSWILNTLLAPLVFFRSFTMVNILIARPMHGGSSQATTPSVSIVVPARNESGNIAAILRRCPKMGPDDELIFIEGNSTDDTWEAIQREASAYQGPLRIVTAKQEGKGKGDAVRKGFALARNEILMILDADLTVSPEDLPKFYDAIRLGQGEFINGSRLVYPMEERAMRFFNLLGNKFFAVGFTYVLGQKIKDTLCGTKVIRKSDYLKLASHRSYFGEFDPFGDFDLLFGAARLALKVVEIPIRYRERTYGTTNIQRWRHGIILLGMLMLGARKFRFL